MGCVESSRPPLPLLFSAPGRDGGWDGFDAAGQLGDLLRDGDKNI
jgi:hypothetical protein